MLPVSNVEHVTTCSVQISKSLPEDFKRGKMDFFQGSSPPNFISFCLENCPPEGETSSVDPPQLLPPTTGNAAQETPVAANALFSPQSITSEVDVNSYADAVVQRMETQQFASQENRAMGEVDKELESTEIPERQTTQTDPIPRGTSTPIPIEEASDPHLDLTALESALVIATTSNSQYPELLTATKDNGNDLSRTALNSEEDNASSVYEVPALPNNEPKVRFLADLSEGEKTSEETSSFVRPSLYGHIPGLSESEANAGDESGISTPLPEDLIASTSRGPDDQLPELSGRSRAILKTYFLEEKAFNLPRGHPTVAFTEPQIYHLLRVLTDETLRMSHANMEQMILDAVRGKPTALPSRTESFRSRARASTPFRPADSDSSDTEVERFTSGESDDQDTQRRINTGDSSYSGESDSAGEMALITATYKPCTQQNRPPPELVTPFVSGEQGGMDTDLSSQDATLSEVREQTLSSKSKRASRDKKTPRPKRQIQRGVPMREEFFAKIGWTRSFISGPADPIHNPHMVWCHMCKKNFSIRSKGPFEILRHHRTEKHLRRDQRWRYEHLRSVDPVSGVIQHRVRGRNGKILNKMELAKEMPKFIHTELVDIGERFPFYDDFIRGRNAPLVTPESRARTQLCLIGEYIPTHGDLSVLRSMWAQISSFTDYQAALCDFDWGEERITVSIPYTYLLVDNLLSVLGAVFHFRPSSNISSIAL